ncbi:hypothetical protein HYH02_015420 [Chlamydomonas schloesseri]|uniref:Uncharacterized protein n=1 Tax=Chlamydomonas schloesseri TaxID=2026947 RepID=A0A835S868_9CHLO|nr:hypothetical protein HYH02_015420 [Chlamydomonas schloesseri]|eukprot:KAG2422542.1 hypothetical protein HYH02_015420 [Chlamydomonas schloesseri]
MVDISKRTCDRGQVSLTLKEREVLRVIEERDGPIHTLLLVPTWETCTVGVLEEHRRKQQRPECSLKMGGWNEKGGRAQVIRRLAPLKGSFERVKLEVGAAPGLAILYLPQSVWWGGNLVGAADGGTAALVQSEGNEDAETMSILGAMNPDAMGARSATVALSDVPPADGGEAGLAEAVDDATAYGSGSGHEAVVGLADMDMDTEFDEPPPKGMEPLPAPGVALGLKE